MAARGSGSAARRDPPRREPQRRPVQQRRKPVQSQQRRPAQPRQQSVVIPFPAPQQRPKQRRRPISREEARRRQEIRLHQQAMEEQSRELAKGPIDLPFGLLVLLLMSIGLVMLLSASFPSSYYNTRNNNPTYYFIRQGVFAIMGIAGMLFIGKINYQRFRGMAKTLLYVSIFLLIFVAIPGNPVAVTVKGATRWIGVGELFSFQPSEIAKMAIVIYFSDSISKKKDLMRSFRYGILPYAAILVATAGLVAIEPHLSGAILILGVGAALMLVGGINWAWVFGALGGAAAMLYFALFVVGYNTSRIQFWLNPWADAQDKGYQLSQSLITIGSGGLLGVGLGKSRQKFLFLPEEHNDFIFAIICEELGLIGASIIMLLFAALILRGYWIALHARDRFGSLLVIGVTTLIAMQTFLNIGVVTGLLPTTGISLPFFSYGGTALSIQLAEMGVVLSVSRQMKPTRAG
ncbi:putative lipid II flippase FtsW [uncultured Oscillibacter sp.]|uniref:putative lipid II flippase FtsW n=1 Tax=uncultured Oscillibacter sp. TaxID=876091 RepID=UPI00261DA77F|nr:putative lipid II flippase FtsW [uncultured Oscillibacter sp.]